MIQPDQRKCLINRRALHTPALYDLKRIIDGGETNYITATLDIYLSVFNVFQSLLSLLGLFGGERD